MLEFYVGAALSLAAALVLGYYGVRVRSVIREEREASEIIKSIARELGTRISRIDKEVVEQGVRLEVAELRLSRFELMKERGAGKVSSGGVDTFRSVQPESQVDLSRDVTRSFGGREGVPAYVSPTGRRVLELLREGRMSAKEIQDRLGKSREHTARLLKELYEGGYVVRDVDKRPYTYELARK